MSKERLEEIEKQIDWMELKPSQVNAISQILDYAEKQAKRVQELEEEIKTHEPHGRNYTNEQYVKLRERVQELERRIADDEHFIVGIMEQNKRYREAIRKILLKEHENMEGYETEIFTLAKNTLNLSDKELTKLLEGEE